MKHLTKPLGVAEWALLISAILGFSLGTYIGETEIDQRSSQWAIFNLAGEYNKINDKISARHYWEKVKQYDTEHGLAGNKRSWSLAKKAAHNLEMSDPEKNKAIELLKNQEGVRFVPGQRK